MLGRVPRPFPPTPRPTPGGKKNILRPQEAGSSQPSLTGAHPAVLDCDPLPPPNKSLARAASVSTPGPSLCPSAARQWSRAGQAVLLITCIFGHVRDLMGHGNASVFLQPRYLKSGGNFLTSFLCTILALGSANALYTSHSLAHQGAGHRGNWLTGTRTDTALGEAAAGAQPSGPTQLTAVLSVQVVSQLRTLTQKSLEVREESLFHDSDCGQAGRSPSGKPPPLRGSS